VIQPYILINIMICSQLENTADIAGRYFMVGLSFLLFNYRVFINSGCQQAVLHLNMNENSSPF
jgi:hypothetical protein